MWDVRHPKAERPLRTAISTGRCNIESLTAETRKLPMKYRTRINYTEEQKALMWDRWQKGDTLHDIGRLAASRVGRLAAGWTAFPAWVTMRVVWESLSVI